MTVFARARQIVAERGSAEQQAVCAQLWAGKLDTQDRLRHYYAVMGPMYARRYDAQAAQQGRERGILSPEALNRAFAPGGFLQGFDLRPELAAIRARTLVIAGRHDWICPPEFSEEIHGLIPGSRLRVFEDSSHSLRVDAPGRMVEEIRRFVGD